MENKEKKLIKSLFKRLKNAEKKSSLRDEKAEKFIKECLLNQPNSVYYMIQIILVQEVAIQKLHKNIEDLEKLIEKNSFSQSNKKSFLSGLLEKYTTPSIKKNSSSINLKKNIPLNINRKYESSFGSDYSNIISSGSSFLGNALQTAVGVAGGVVVGNMLTNLFHKHKPEDNLFNSNSDFPSINRSKDFNENDLYLNNNNLKSSSFVKENDSKNNIEDIKNNDLDNNSSDSNVSSNENSELDSNNDLLDNKNSLNIDENSDKNSYISSSDNENSNYDDVSDESFETENDEFFSDDYY
ncbi:MAG: DUF2076 family protein [Buchnera aphidicola (Periphyllus lyropictus)]|uniref:DUF2076 domain-containing protein n=1 Tax=Buchnera aphidicola TaxID=9 RepID=UPI001ED05D39|nr:DUF2076 family protein [Buchnera aphidicola]NIH16669.1 DUF2076 family protein [Buchnera aphidicola (Periphyllus lyropictus)]USS94576.1 DUF2076 family protein [Buchnera aphidicola (Periphyllus lyropictus)]